jgi:hypothetical protein
VDILSAALGRLTLGRAALYAAILDEAKRRDATSTLELAVSGLRRAGQQQYLPLGLLTRAWCFFAKATQDTQQSQLPRARDCLSNAQGDLDEAWEIAERGPMPLHMADIHLHRARLFGRMTGEPLKYPWESPQHDLAEARRLIVKHGYLRRMPELEDAEAALLG